MFVEINLKNGKDEIFDNVLSVSTGSSIFDGKLCRDITISMIGNIESQSFKIDDVSNFSIFEKQHTWFDDCTEIVCPYCNTHFNSEIVYTMPDNGNPKYCPACGREVIK